MQTFVPAMKMGLSGDEQDSQCNKQSKDNAHRVSSMCSMGVFDDVGVLMRRFL